MTNLAPDLVPTGPLCGSGSSWHQSDVVGYQHHPHIRFPLEIIIRIKNFIVNHLSEHCQSLYFGVIRFKKLSILTFYIAYQSPNV